MNQDASFPKMALVEQQFDSGRVQDVEGAVRAELERSGIGQKIKPGQSVAVSAGSRGICALDRILAAACAWFGELGAAPFVFPAMGSHGGATDQGQLKVLADLGVTEDRIKAPIRSSMRTVSLGRTDSGMEVRFDALAAKADHVLCLNRVKAHTKFKAPLESGLFKMMVVGMGKHAGAVNAHRQALRGGFHQVLVQAGRLILEKAPILAGLGVVENGYGRINSIRVFPAREMERGEEELLLLAKKLAPKIPFDELDLLIVDLIGKDVSGTGMDTNVTGRNRDLLGDFCISPKVKRIVVRDLTERTAGNALGLGYADFTTDRLVKAMDYHKTVTNALTGISPEKAAVPIHFPTDRETIRAALDSLGLWTPETVRVVRIKSTAALDRIMASAPLLPLLPEHARPLSPPSEMEFDRNGDLPAFPSAK